MNESENERSKGGCPVDHNAIGGSWNIPDLFAGRSKPPPTSDQTTNAEKSPLGTNEADVSSRGACPVKHAVPERVPASIEQAAKHAQTPHYGQRIPLSTKRTVSSIPRGISSENPTPSHQPSSSHNWVYPSEQQFYNAMKRKGWEADESTMPLVVRIHNAVNERGWNEVCKWEALHGCKDPQLVRFLGRPKDMSPKAFLNTYLWGYRPPFDRHDWYVDRGDGSEPRRYVIDFYNGNDGSGNSKSLLSTLLHRVSGKEDQAVPDTMEYRPPAMYLDVRPALDRPDAFVDRSNMFVRDAFPGLFATFASSPATAPQSSETHGNNNDKSTG